MLKFNIKFLIVAIGLCLPWLANAESNLKPNTKSAEQEVLASFHSLVDASKKLDVKAYFQHFDADKFVGLNSDGTNWNSIDDLEPIINAGFGSVKKVISLEFPNVRVSMIDDYTAVLINEFTQTILLKSGNTFHLAGGGTQVWSKRSGQWKLVSVSASSKTNVSAQ